MKLVQKSVVMLFVAIMALFSIIGFNLGFGRAFFAGGSDVLMELVASSLYVKIILLFSFVLVVVAFRKTKNRALYYSVLFILFSAWLLSGRTVGLFAYGRLSTGWFYFESNRTYLCKDWLDPEVVLNRETVYEKESFWRYRISNNQTEKVIFVGPFITKEVDSLLHSNFRENAK